MKVNKKLLAICLAAPLAVGGIAALLTRDSMKIFETLNKPPLSPPGWLFPVVWTALYILMGIASYLVCASGRERAAVDGAIRLYGAQLAVNFIWPILFFKLEMYLLAFIWLILLWALILAVILRFARLNRTAGRIMIPYLLWVTFAGYLNCGVWLLN